MNLRRAITPCVCLFVAIVGAACFHHALAARNTKALDGLVQRGGRAGAQPFFFALVAAGAPEGVDVPTASVPLPRDGVQWQAFTALAKCVQLLPRQVEDANWSYLVSDVLSGDASALDDGRWEDFARAIARHSWPSATTTLVWPGNSPSSP